jgi:hypothetical protein
VEFGARVRRNLRLQQDLKAATHALWGQCASSGSLHAQAQLGGAITGECHGLFSVWL